ncbi:hypothetical protein DV704_10465 [Meiothermus sp. QL-1]|uniref:hypothetical protein n=1 Tax=Meiothermus sp. QL-1 TaxID=2058095 RepID=UPI000E0AF79C|nr:hypothetical protein [Meiothermus sp. QL-1]RDI94715.1 hypothetical protein DV704_10465 [Meiothermus sp. QL-1]
MNLLQRIPQPAKVAIAAVLLVGAVALWYWGFFRPNQIAETTPATPTQPASSPPTATARPLEVIPLPFLVTEAPRSAEPEENQEAPGNAALGRPRVTVPPNPFVPLVVETPTPPAASAPVAALPAPSPPVSAQPIPIQPAQVQVRQPATPLPAASLPGTRANIAPAPTPAASTPTPPGQARLVQGSARASLPNPINLGTGPLPIRLLPLERELSSTPEPQSAQPALDLSPSSAERSVLEFARAELELRTAQALELRTSPPSAPEASRNQESSLARFVREQGLRLSGVVLGPTSVAIFQNRDGFVVLPVGRTLPGSDVLLKSLNAREALLVRGSESLTLTIEKP